MFSELQNKETQGLMQHGTNNSIQNRVDPIHAG